MSSLHTSTIAGQADNSDVKYNAGAFNTVHIGRPSFLSPRLRNEVHVDGDSGRYEKVGGHSPKCPRRVRIGNLGKILIYEDDSD